MRVLVSIFCTCLFVLGFAHNLQAQTQIANSSASGTGGGGGKPRDGLNGQVRRVRVEIVNLLVKQGKTVEGPRVVREITTYDQKGQKVDSVAYPAEDSRVAGNKQYLRDARGNVIEMVVRADDGSILNKEKYDYQFDEFGNWKRMIASVAVYENGNVGYEPFEITYRTITYYYAQRAPKVISDPTGAPISETNPTATITALANDTQPITGATVGVNANEVASSDAKRTSSAAEAIAVKPEKSGPSNVVATALTAKDDAPLATVIQMSEEALRKAAIDLPEPRYPEGAKRTAAKEKVAVQIVVDDKGEVTNASALSGDPVFSEVAVAAARKARFSRAKLAPNRAKVYGVLNYTFTLPVEKPAPSRLVNGASSELKESQPNQGVSTSAKPPTGDSSESTPKPASDAAETAASFYARGLTFLASGRRSEAAVELKQAIERDPNDAAAYAKLGIAYAGLKQYSEAVVVLKMASRIKPEILDAEAYYHLGFSYFTLGKHKEALEAFKRALYITRAQGLDKDEAKAQTFSHTEEIYYSLGLTYLNLERYREAIKELNEALKINPKLAEACYALAIAYLRLGDRSSAQKQQRILISLNPGLAGQLADELATKNKELPCKRDPFSLQCP